MSLQVMAARARINHTSSDPNFAYVVSLLNMPGPNGSFTFTDVKGKSWSRGGNAHIDTSLGFNVGLFNAGNGADEIDTADNTDFDFAGGDFTIRAWVLIGSAATTFNRPFICHDNIGGTRGWLLLCDKDFSGELTFYAYQGTTQYFVRAPATFPVGTMTFIEVSRVGNTIYLFQDGVLQDSTTVTGVSINAPGSRIYIGALCQSNIPNTSLGGINGWIKAIEVYKGKGLHTANFTPPPAPFPES